ncbi:MAG: hypothetical protein IKZ28_03085 [Clostridia bacterium]|nr:hypothetical protein [Clostridia bacterium]
MSETKPKKIVFVCTGNTCRSPMAEYLLKKVLRKEKLRGFRVCSAGTEVAKGDGMNPYSLQTLAEHGIEVKTFKSTALNEKLLSEAFAFICMTERHRDLLLDMRWHALRKTGVDEIENNVYSFKEFTGYDVPDPYGWEIDKYHAVYDMLEGGMYAIIDGLELRACALPPTPRKKKTDSIDIESKEKTAPKKRGRPKKQTVNS